MMRPTCFTTALGTITRAWGGGSLATRAMDHADGSSTSRNWDLTSDDALLVKTDFEYNSREKTTGKQSVSTWLRDYLKEHFGSRTSGKYVLATPNFEFRFEHGSESYYAF